MCPFCHVLFEIRTLIHCKNLRLQIWHWKYHLRMLCVTIGYWDIFHQFRPTALPMFPHWMIRKFDEFTFIVGFSKNFIYKIYLTPTVASIRSKRGPIITLVDL